MAEGGHHLRKSPNPHPLFGAKLLPEPMMTQGRGHHIATLGHNECS